MNLSLILRNSKTAILAFLLVFLAMPQSSFAQCDSEPYQKGKTIFMAQCASCHAINKKMTGPALAGVYDKYSSEWLYKWIKNSQALVKEGDPDAIKVFNEYNGSIMPAQNLSNADIDLVLGYIQTETDTPCTPVVADTADGSGGGTSQSMLIFLGIITAILFFIFFAMNRLTGELGRMVKEKMGILVPETAPLEKRFFNKKMGALLSILALIVLGYYTVGSATALGRQKGYQPKQPIKFSHQLHAGVHEIECQYCHSGAGKGKSAVIPSANVCMNCHKAVSEGPKYGTAEIAKIYDAVGWDAENQKYKENYVEKPIEWIRIHNLPDHVYFSHAQHVNAGGVECQTCHGEIQEMEVVEQHSSLGMGWCINCHRQTEVNFKGNDYYNVYEEFHKDLKNDKINKVTVEDIGGLECQKCHY